MRINARIITSQPLKLLTSGTSVEISVTDTGTGIPPKDIPRLGERFYRVDPARSRELGGTGLGLAIVKHLVVSMNGKISIESEYGKGTRISFTMPKAEKDEG